MNIQFIINHIRNRKYMSGIEREKNRIRSTGEVFTRYELVKVYLDYCEQEYPNAFILPENAFCDNSCGDGQFLGEILIRKVERGINFETALTNIYGVDFEQTNVTLCRDRLLCGREDLRHIVERNIVQHDGLKYDYSFNGKVHESDDPSKESKWKKGWAMTDEQAQLSDLFVF